ncbi:MAG TPA: lipopolysaccharide heptosyltransferase I [Burkholderiaceae bacterium]|nr:lipopolysaccharide heptosyltransferase I [Burkholderiaceae bacterium]
MGRARKVLIVKTSSMGDVVHALPALSDMRRLVPGIMVDWLVEAPFAAIPALHPGVRRVLPLAWRKWRRRLLDRSTWSAIVDLRRELRSERYDLVLDLQGLLKSALWGAQARGPMVGYDWRSAWEPLATLLYRRTAAVEPRMQAVERCRRLAAAHLGYVLPATAPDFGIHAAKPQWEWVPSEHYAALIPCASRPEKLWPEDRWIEVGRRLLREGERPVVLWGSDAERQMAERIARGCEGIVPPFLAVKDCAGVLGRAERIVGLDTGLSHLGAALGRPTVGIYCDHDPGMAGITGSGPVASIGGRGVVPSLADVLGLIDRVAAGAASLHSGDSGDSATDARDRQSSSIRTGG